MTANCPACGASAPITSQNAKIFACSYCGQTSVINVSGLEAIGQQVLLVDYGSKLQVGNNYKLDSKSFTVLGRVRYNYKDGFWDEWLCDFYKGSDSLSWLHEDEGDFMLLESIQNNSIQSFISSNIGFANFKVGSNYKIGEYSTFITEKLVTEVNGSEGQLPFLVIPKQKVSILDGIIDNNTTISIEFTQDGTFVYKGTPISVDQISKS